jgi:uncharacterized membrane protein
VQADSQLTSAPRKKESSPMNTSTGRPSADGSTAPTEPSVGQWIVSFVTMVVASSSMEGIWYLGVAENFYHQQIGALLNVEFDVTVAALFYFVYALGALTFALGPALRARSWTHALRAGALYGFFCFCAHNLTDLADVRGYTMSIALIDIAWGTFMSAVACTLSFAAARRLAA